MKRRDGNMLLERSSDSSTRLHLKCLDGDMMGGR